MTLESILSLTSFLVTGLLGILFYRLFRKQKEQVASLQKNTEQIRYIEETLALFQMNKPDDHILSPAEAKLQAYQKFKFLPFEEKIVYIQDYGTYLAARHLNEYQINLYHLNGFFVEVWHSQLTGCPTGIRTFTRKNCLEVYADLINLEID